MNKQIRFLQRVNIVPQFPCEPEFPQKEVCKRDKFEDLLDIIYSIDPRTGTPRGDLAMFTSADANPEIRAFIQSNLMMEMPSSDGTGLKMPDAVKNSFNRNISDDDIALLSRNQDESVDEYAERLKTHVHDMKLNYQRERETRRLQKKLSDKKDAE